MLRGINLDNGAATYEVDDSSYSMADGIAQGATFRSRITEDERDYARLESWGVNSVRFMLDWHWYAANRAQFYAFMDQHVGWARAHHMWLIPTMGVPPGGLQDYSEGTRFWGADPSYRNQLKTFWVDFAQRYANEPIIAGYDLLNEPSSEAVGVDWFPYASQLRDAVWAGDRNHFVVIESHIDGLFDQRLPVGNPVKYPNVVYSLHGYDPESMTHNGVFGPAHDYTYPGYAPDYDGVSKLWNLSTLDQMMRVEGRMPITWAQEANVPLWMGEWGTVKRTKGYLPYLADQITLMQRWGMHWAHFAYREYDFVTDFGVYNAPTTGMTSDLPADTAMAAIIRAGMAGNVHPR
jgi:hypothetical protein